MGNIDEEKLIKALSEGKSKREAGVIAGSESKTPEQSVDRVLNHAGHSFGQKLLSEVEKLQTEISGRNLTDLPYKQVLAGLDVLSKVIERGIKSGMMLRSMEDEFKDIPYELLVETDFIQSLQTIEARTNFIKFNIILDALDMNYGEYKGKLEDYGFDPQAAKIKRDNEILTNEK